MPESGLACILARSHCATRRLAREAEGAPLLREYGVKSSIEGSNPSVSASSAVRQQIAPTFALTHYAAMHHNCISAPVAQLDRAPGYELGGREFESLRARHQKSTRVNGLALIGPFALRAIFRVRAKSVSHPCHVRANRSCLSCQIGEKGSSSLVVAPREIRSGYLCVHSIGCAGIQKPLATRLMGHAKAHALDRKGTPF